MKLSEAQQAELEKIREWACCFEPERRFMAEAEVAQLEVINAELLETLELVMRCDEKGFINLKPSWHNQVRQAIAKAKS